MLLRLATFDAFELLIIFIVFNFLEFVQMRRNPQLLSILTKIAFFTVRNYNITFNTIILSISSISRITNCAFTSVVLF